MQEGKEDFCEEQGCPIQNADYELQQSVQHSDTIDAGAGRCSAGHTYRSAAGEALSVSMPINFCCACLSTKVSTNAGLAIKTEGEQAQPKYQRSHLRNQYLSCKSHPAGLHS